MSFFVTTIAYYPEDGPKSKYGQPYKCTHTFGHFLTLDDAQEAVEGNYGGMDECLYNYLLIEEIGYGIYAGLVNDPENDKQFEWWYRWEHPDGQEGHWVTMEKPDWSKGIINWSVG